MKQNKTILLVDDDPELRAGLRTLLQRRGYHTLEADDGFEARELIDGHSPDLVILDMMMPRWGGFAVLEHFQGQSQAPPFIMITAHEGDKHKAYAEQLGVVDYIRKPFSFEGLLQRVESGLRQTAAEAGAKASGELPTIRCRCNACGARIKAAVQLLGQSRPCPRCGESLLVQPQPPDDAEPALV
jgi:DNA-binding response OmpR family regulator